MHGFRYLVMTGAAAATLSACAPAMDQAAFGSANNQTMLIVENNNWSDMVIYVLRGAHRSRVGSVASMTTVRFKLPGSAAGLYGEMRIVADPIGSDRAFTSQVINVVPGANVEVRVENNIAVSSLSVY